jgi:hypothetical protein
VAPARLVPFLGTEVRAADAGVVAVRNTSQATLDLLDWMLADRAPVYADGRLNPDGLVALHGVLADALGLVADARGALNAAPRPRLGFVRVRFDEADRVTGTLYDTLSGALPLVDRLAAAAKGDDPYRLLLLLENGAERRATGGFVGFVALFEVNQTGVQLAQLGSVGNLKRLDAAGQFEAVNAPADYLRRYEEFLANTTLWVNVNLSPDFPTVAQVAKRLYQVATGVEPDAVMRIDLVGLGYLLDAFPEVAVEGVEIHGGALSSGFLIDSYQRFPILGDQTNYLISVMRDVFGQLIGGARTNRSAVVGALTRAVVERRAALVTEDQAVNAMLAAVGAEGSVLSGASGDLMVTTQNFAANKVDLFTGTEVIVNASPDGCRVAAELRLTLTNATPADMDWLPHERIGNRGRWMVSVYLPRGAAMSGFFVNGAPAAGSFLEEFGRMAASVIVDADVGKSVTVTVSWLETLTQPGYTLTLQPQPLVVPATLGINGEAPVPFAETVRRELPGVCQP